MERLADDIEFNDLGIGADVKSTHKNQMLSIFSHDPWSLQKRVHDNGRPKAF